MGCQGSKAAVATQQPTNKTLLAGDSSPKKARDTSPKKAGDTSPKKLALAIERDVPAEAKIGFPKQLTLTKVSGSPALLVGRTVEVVEGFEAMLSDQCEVPTMLKKGSLGVVSEIDEDGDALIEFSQDGETFEEWVDQAEFPKLRLKAVVVGCTIKVLQEVEGISEGGVMLKKGLLGVVREIDEDGDARIEFSQGGEVFEEWVDRDDFSKLQIKAADFAPKVIVWI